MTWHFTHTGTRAGVLAAVAAEKDVPQSVKDEVERVVAEFKPIEGFAGLKVTCGGHATPVSFNVHLEVDQIKLVMDPEPKSET